MCRTKRVHATIESDVSRYIAVGTIRSTTQSTQSDTLASREVETRPAFFFAYRCTGTILVLRRGKCTNGDERSCISSSPRDVGDDRMYISGTTLHPTGADYTRIASRHCSPDASVRNGCVCARHTHGIASTVCAHPPPYVYDAVGRSWTLVPPCACRMTFSRKRPASACRVGDPVSTTVSIKQK